MKALQLAEEQLRQARSAPPEVAEEPEPEPEVIEEEVVVVEEVEEPEAVALLEPAPMTKSIFKVYDRPEASASGIIRPKKMMEAKAAAAAAAAAVVQPENQIDKTNVNLAAPKDAVAKVYRPISTPIVDDNDDKGKSGKLKLRGGDERRGSSKITVQQALSNVELVG